MAAPRNFADRVAARRWTRPQTVRIGTCPSEYDPGPADAVGARDNKPGRAKRDQGHQRRLRPVPQPEGAGAASPSPPSAAAGSSALAACPGRNRNGQRLPARAVPEVRERLGLPALRGGNGSVPDGDHVAGGTRIPAPARPDRGQPPVRPRPGHLLARRAFPGRVTSRSCGIPRARSGSAGSSRVPSSPSRWPRRGPASACPARSP